MVAGRPAYRTARWQKVTALVPLALLAGAWTVSLSSAPTAVADLGDNDPGVPAVPTTAFDSPASYTAPAALGPSSFGANQHDPATSADPLTQSIGGIPAAALLAYQRAEAVLGKADPSCQLSWELIAAIGRVESDHGRYGGNILARDGRSKPGIYGIRLDGSHGTALIKDTDDGGYDHDPVYDRAVGAMQIVPGTWEIVGVDGDGDGVRDPQDIDDSSLAAAVYLCAGDNDLSTAAGQRSAVFNYNHSEAYVDLVLSIMNAYLNGDYTAVADGLPSATYIPPIAQPISPGSTGPHSNNPSSDNPGGSRSTSHSSAHHPLAGTTNPSRPGQPPSSRSTRTTPSNRPPPTTSNPLPTSNPAPGDSGPTATNPGPGSAVPPTSNPVPTTSNPGPGSPVPTTYSGPGNPGPTTSNPVPTTSSPVPTTYSGPGNPGPTTSSPVPTTSSPVPTTSNPVPTTSNPVPTTSNPVPTSPTATATVAPVVDPVVKATRVCEAAFADADYSPSPSELDQCIDAYQTGGIAAVNALIDLLTAVPVPTTPVPTPTVPPLPIP